MDLHIEIQLSMFGNAPKMGFNFLLLTFLVKQVFKSELQNGFQVSLKLVLPCETT